MYKSGDESPPHQKKVHYEPPPESEEDKHLHLVQYTTAPHTIHTRFTSCVIIQLCVSCVPLYMSDRILHVQNLDLLGSWPATSNECSIVARVKRINIMQCGFYVNVASRRHMLSIPSEQRIDSSTENCFNAQCARTWSQWLS